MSFGKRILVDELQTISQFESLRKILHTENYAQHLKKPLRYWAYPADRHLPLAFLGLTLSDLLKASYQELAQTPGIGLKKMASLVKLLSRAANTDPAQLPTDVENLHLAVKTATTDRPDDESANKEFDAEAISELEWEHWRASLLRHKLGEEKIGRLAPSLQGLTRVIWNTPLATYANYTLAEIQALKTHGAKRINSILEVFHNIHNIVANMAGQDHLAIRIVPRQIDQAEEWVGQWLQKPGIPGEEDIFRNFISPLLMQIRIDAQQQIVSLAENRLGIQGPISSVRKVARSKGFTRARVYQLLNEINDIMTVRWPLGRHQVYELRAKFVAEAKALDSPPALEQFLAAVELFYPCARRGANGPLEQSGENQ